MGSVLSSDNCKKQKKASLGLLLLDTTSVVSLHFYFRFFIQFSRYACGEQFAFPIHRKINHYARFYFAAVLASQETGFARDALISKTRSARDLPPAQPVVGSNGLEPSTSRLSGVRSNHLSYEPMYAVLSCRGVCPFGLLLCTVFIPRAPNQSFNRSSLASCPQCNWWR